jgi:phosphoribulokinase
VPRPTILGVVGDSAAGKTTLTRGLVRILGEEQVTLVCTDDCHRYDRKQRAERNITPLDPECNYVDIMAHDLRHLRAGEAILKPVYRHADGTFGPPVYVGPKTFTVIEGLLGYYTADMRDVYDVRVFLAPPEDLRRKWKVDRDCSRRGYTTDQVLAELDRREPDSAAYIRPQERYADLVVSFMPGGTGEAEHLDAELMLREGLPHPDLSPFIGNGARGITLLERGADRHMRIPGDIERERAAELEEAIWDRLHFATHLRSQRLGEFTVGTELHRSESLALVQLLILYHVVTARAAIALGATGTRAESPGQPVDAGERPHAPTAGEAAAPARNA